MGQQQRGPAPFRPDMGSDRFFLFATAAVTIFTVVALTDVVISVR
jgi:hypothetical protein